MSSRTIAEVLDTPIEERHEMIAAAGGSCHALPVDANFIPTRQGWLLNPDRIGRGIP